MPTDSGAEASGGAAEEPEQTGFYGCSAARRSGSGLLRVPLALALLLVFRKRKARDPGASPRSA